MEKKWRIFRVVIIAQLAISFLFVVLDSYSLYNLFQQRYHRSITFFHPGFVVLYVMSCLLIFNIFCLFLIQKKYPAGELSKTNEIIFVLTYCLEVAACLVLLFITYIGTTETLGHLSKRLNVYEIFILILVLLLTISNLYSLVKAIQFWKYIKRNSALTNHQLIEEIGT